MENRVRIFRRIALAGLAVCFGIAGRADNPDPGEYTYPRLSLGSAWVDDWVGKPGYGMDFLYQFGQINTDTPPSAIIQIKQKAINEGHAAWAQNVRFIHKSNLQSTDIRYHQHPQTQWLIDQAPHSIDLVRYWAVYYNGLQGCDWILRDISGNPVKTWGEDYVAINTTPSCPPGTWDGKVLFNGVEMDLGLPSTVGITYYEWLSGPFTQTVIRGSLFAQAYSGFQSEDSADSWLYTYRGQTPDPLRDGVGMTYEQLEAYGRATWDNYWTVFLKNLQPDFTTRLNGHGLKYFVEGGPNPTPEYQAGATACKLEGYGDWGGYPTDVLPKWIRVYLAIEDLYHPVSGIPDHPVYDGIEGWDQTSLQSEPRFDWPQDQRDRFSRATLSAALMGDGFWDGFSYFEDQYFHKFLRGGAAQYAPHVIPEALVKLGKARGAYQVHNANLGYPMYYRRFADPETGHAYTVVHNPWDFEIQGIPPEDGKWFYGDWPDGTFSESPLPGAGGGGGSGDEGGGGGGGSGGGGCFVGPSPAGGTVAGLLLLSSAFVLTKKWRRP